MTPTSYSASITGGGFVANWVGIIINHDDSITYEVENTEIIVSTASVTTTLNTVTNIITYNDIINTVDNSNITINSASITNTVENSYISIATASYTVNIDGTTQVAYTTAGIDAGTSNAIHDEDDQISNSDTHLVTQQSIKAYSDNTKCAKTGFQNIVDSVLSFTTATTTVNITGNPYLYYIDGKNFTGSTASVVIGETSSGSLSWVYFTSAGIVSSANIAIDNTRALVNTLYWDGTRALLMEERHGTEMGVGTHRELHLAIGSLYGGDGLEGTFASASFAITGGRFFDEDIMYNMAATATATPLYFNGDAHFEIGTAGVTTGYLEAGGIIQYNNVNVLADVDNNKHVAYFFFAVPTIPETIVCVMGQRQDTKLSDARTNNTYENLSLSSFPSEEIRVLYRVIYKRTAAGTSYIEKQDLRQLQNAGGGNYTNTSHLTLSDLPVGDSGHTQFVMRDGTKDLTADWPIATASIVLASGTISAQRLAIGTSTASYTGYIEHTSTAAIADGLLVNNACTDAGAYSLIAVVQSNVGSASDAGIFNVDGEQNGLNIDAEKVDGSISIPMKLAFSKLQGSDKIANTNFFQFLPTEGMQIGTAGATHLTPAVNNIYIKGELEVDNGIFSDGQISANAIVASGGITGNTLVSTTTLTASTASLTDLIFTGAIRGGNVQIYADGVNTRIVSTGDLQLDSGTKVEIYDNLQVDGSASITGAVTASTASLTEITLAGDINGSSGTHIKTDEVKAVDGDGLKLYDDGGNGITIADGTKMGIYQTTLKNVHASYAQIQIGYSAAFLVHKSANYIYYMNNAYYEGAWKRINAGPAHQWNFNNDGSIYFLTSANGSADTAIGWTYTFNIKNTGRVGVMTSVPGYPFHCVGNAYFSLDVSALTFTDRTPFPESKQEAYDIINSIERDAVNLNKINKDKLHKKIKKHFSHKNPIGIDKNGEQIFEDVEEDGRDLSLTVSALCEVVKDIKNKLDLQETEIEELKARIIMLEA